MCRVASGQERQRVERARNAVGLLDVVRCRHACLERGESSFEDAARLGTVEWRGRAERTQHRQLDDDFFGGPVPPACEHESATAGLRLGGGDGPPQFRARIGGERPAGHPEHHVSHCEHAVRRRPGVDGRDGDLPRVGRHEPVAEHPPTESGRAQVPVVGRLGRNLVTLGEIRDLDRAVGGDGRWHDESHCRADDADARKKRPGHG